MHHTDVTLALKKAACHCKCFTIVACHCQHSHDPEAIAVKMALMNDSVS